MQIKSTVLYILTCVVLTTTLQAKVHLSFVPEIGLMSGTTEYEMDYRYEFVNYYTGSPVLTEWRVNSLLEFPLDVSLGGLTANLYPEDEPNKWNLSLKYLTSLSNPNDKMKDSDWEGITTFFPYTQFSYTESDAEVDLKIYEFEARYRVGQKEHVDYSLFLGVKFQNLNQDILGYDGWYRPFDTIQLEYFDSTVSQSGYPDTVVLDYNFKFEQISFGLQGDIFLSDKISTKLKVALAPVFFNDTDDHILRKKESKSNGIGMGYNAAFDISYDLPYRYISFIKLKSFLNTFTAEGSQMQFWYEVKAGLDPTSQVGKIPHKIRSTYYMFNIEVGIEI